MKEIHVQVNPYLEYMNSILLTGRYNEITTPYIGYGLMTADINPYTTRVKHFFEKYCCDPVYPHIESMIPGGFTFSRPVELMLSLGNNTDFSMQYPLSDLCVTYCGGHSKIHELLYLLKDLERKSGYFSFFEKEKCYYDPFIEKATQVVNEHPYIAILEEMYGKTQNSYHYVISSLMLGNFGISFGDKETQKADIFSVFTTDHFSLSAAILFHEFSHPFINPLTEKYADIVKEYESAYELLKQYKLPGFRSGYGDWNECVNEHFVRAMVIYLLQKLGLPGTAEEMLYNDLHRGYKYIPLLLEQYEYYENHRDRYPNFDSFYPDLIKVFSQDPRHI